MRYETIKDLPDTLQDVLPEEAQRLYLTTYQRVWDEYKPAMGGEMDRESVAHRQAMKAVDEAFVLDKASSNWVPREELEDTEDGVAPVNVQPGNQA